CPGFWLLRGGTGWVSPGRMLPPLATFCLVARSRGGILFAPTEAATATCVEIETCRVRYYGSARCRHRSQVLVCQALAAWPHLAGGAPAAKNGDISGVSIHGF